MGHREDLLEGAKRCLLAKGFMRTTARDIVKESGTNLASIGYHYGSKDALLVQAYISLVGDTGDAFEGKVEDTEPGSLERFELVWSNIVGTMKQPGSVWRLSMEALALGDRMPEVRERLSQAQREAGRSLVPLLMGGTEEDVSDETADTVGLFYVTLMTGLIAQWSFDPDTAPEADQLAAGLRRVVEAAVATGGAP
ncbi:TetR/AcrR family transcriptional regulator [Streptomyces sp. NPDC052013]|uniref:TetR/AcrR family transcriptional regulator n=1 Tax=Streptomyces sp. NPDC052013 TaxID=3365679 RepID=UPI0037D5905E